MTKRESIAEENLSTIMDETIRDIKVTKELEILVIYPESLLRTTVDFISFVLIFIISLYIPFVFSFDIDTSSNDLKYFDFVMDLWFMIEIMLNFFTGYYQSGLLVLSKKRIAANYIKSWFFPDILSSFPFSIMYFTDASS